MSKKFDVWEMVVAMERLVKMCQEFQNTISCDEALSVLNKFKKC